jgi:hypothetical protein
MGMEMVAMAVFRDTDKDKEKKLKLNYLTCQSTCSKPLKL